jgi:type III restriction enzyme
MELKRYQQAALDTLRDYLSALKNYPATAAAQAAFVTMANRPYHRVKELGAAPFVCVKIPTGGGKTIVAAHAIGKIFRGYLPERNDRGLVMWFVPSDAIKTQTLAGLRDRRHPYRAALDERFGNAIKVFGLTEAKAIRKSDITDNLCIVVATLASFRRTNKEWLKVYKDNGALMGHFEGLSGTGADLEGLPFLDKDESGGIRYSLANVIKLHNPLVVADEGHNLQTALSFDMLGGLNPSFVLEFTATPRGESNVLVDVLASELKAEHMIKMPIYLENISAWQETIYAGIEKRNELERHAKKETRDSVQKGRGEYIRPIVLIQAEPDRKGKNTVNVEKVAEFLQKEAKISDSEIAIQTSDIKELPSAEILASRECKIKFIITVNALREGWDCPFAYVLVSVSNLGAALSVEQTIGRIMRLPNAHEKKDAALNAAYIFTATKSFNEASQMVINGLHANGYQDIVVSGKKLEPPDAIARRRIADKDAKIPYLNVKDGAKFRRLDYVADLIGEKNILKRGKPAIHFEILEQDRLVKIDIGAGGEIVRDASGKLNLIYHYKDFTKAELVGWLGGKIQRGFISMAEMHGFLMNAVDGLLAVHSIEKLSIHRYAVLEAVERELDHIVDRTSEAKFADLERRKMLMTKGELFIFPDEMELPSVSAERFTRHLYDSVFKMNGEELAVAHALDGLPNITWWFRNPEIGGFYIQGPLKPKFYPDFIVKTKKGNYFVLEYKGEHLIGSDDTDYKERIGKKWAEFGGGKYHFELVTDENFKEVVNRIARL